MDVKPIILTGSHIELIPMKESHSEGLYEAGHYPDIWTFTQGFIASPEDAKAYIRKALEMPHALPFVIADRATGRLLGSTRLYDITVQNRGLEIGSTWLTPDVWRSVVNTECKYLLLKYCFETLGTIRVQLKTDSRNVRSQKAIERLGAMKEGVLRNHKILPDGYIRDSVYYSILDREWPNVKDRLENLLSK